MEAPLPKGCVTVATATSRIDQLSDLAGVVADFHPPTPSRGKDWMATLVLCDKSRALPQTALTVRIFRANMELLPQIKSDNDLILLRNIKVSVRGDRPVGMSTFETTWVISHAPTHANAPPVVVCQPANVKARPDELAYFGALRTWWRSRRGSFVSKGASRQVAIGSGGGGSQKRKFALVRDMQIGAFYDIAGMVVKTFPGNGNYTVYLTDYSKNALLHSYEWGRGRDDDGGGGGGFGYSGRGRGGGGGGNSDWPGPWGQYTLQVTLWDIHAEAAARLLYVGAYASLRNVRAKRNGDGKLEGALHGDRRYPDRVDVELVKNADDLRVRQIMTRMKEYTRRFESDRLRYGREMAQKVEEERKKEEERAARREEGNKNVRCIKPDHPVTPISKIVNPTDVEGTFENRTYRAYCRVIDYLPKCLQDFSVPGDGGSSEEPEWLWRFAFLVEGQDGATLRLIVEGKDAEYLLNMQPNDLRSDDQALLELREKLFVLWGNLEEVTGRKLQSSSNHPTSTPTATTTTTKNHKRRRRRNPGNNKANQPDANSHKRPKYDDLGRPARDSDGDDGGDQVGEGSPAQVEDQEAGKGKMFEACVQEYGVKDARGQWVRVHRLFGTTII